MYTLIITITLCCQHKKAETPVLSRCQCPAQGARGLAVARSSAALVAAAAKLMLLSTCRLPAHCWKRQGLS